MPTILNCLGNWNIPADPDEILASADVIITHEFGDQDKVSLTTLNIVTRGVELAHKYNKPMICQFPGQQIAELAGIKPIRVISRHLTNPGAYLDTEEVNRQAADICKRRKWRKAIIIAHPHHQWRAALNMSTHNIEALSPKTSDIPYDPTLKRLGLRTPALFIPREIAARLMYLKKSWI